VNKVISRLNRIFDWLYAEKLDGLPNPFNPATIPTPRERIMLQAAYEHRRSKAFLGHAWGAEPLNEKGRRVLKAREPRRVNGQPPRFPDGQFPRLLHQGFRDRCGRHNIRDILITLLLHGGGLRLSEPLHMYVSDVSPDPINPGSAFVRIPHPATGRAPAGFRNSDGRPMNRAQFLQAYYQMRPRTQLIGRQHAGWKSEFEFLEVVWFEPAYGQLFWKLWQVYLQQIATIPRGHPFAFVNMNCKESDCGNMYCAESFYESHGHAVMRANIMNLTNSVTGPSKAMGLTPHGHRHAFASRLKKCGVDDLFIMRWMHHGSPDSQLPYTQPTSSESMTALRLAVSKINQDHTLLTLPWIE
jgi:hypothetical protein